MVFTYYPAANSSSALVGYGNADLTDLLRRAVFRPRGAFVNAAAHWPFTTTSPLTRAQQSAIAIKLDTGAEVEALLGPFDVVSGLLAAVLDDEHVPYDLQALDGFYEILSVALLHPAK